MEETVVQAIRAVHAPNTSIQQRQKAGNYLEQFKNDPQACPKSISLFAACPRDDITMQHFFLHCIEHAIKNQWNGWDQEKKNWIKTNILTFASIEFDILSPSRVIAEIIAKLLAELAKRDWPQLWVNFIPEIFKLMNVGYSQASIAIRALHLLAQDANSSEFNNCMPTKRRNEVLKAISTGLSQILKTLYNAIQQQYSMFCANRNGNDGKRIEYFLCICLELLTILAQWMNVNYCFDPEHDFLNVFCTLMREQSHSIRMKACVALHALCSRKTFTEPATNKISPEAAVSRIIETCKQINLDPQTQFPVNESNHEYQKKVIKIVTSIGEVHLISFKPDSPVANAYLDLVCRCFQHTSKKITEKLLGVWYYVLERLPGYIDAPVIKNRIGWLGNVLYEKVLRHGSPEDPAINSPFTQYGIMDFEDHDSFLQSLGIVRSRIITAIKAVARKYPSVMINILGQNMSKILQMSSKATNSFRNDNKDGLMQATLFSKEYVQMEGIMVYLECIMGSLKGNMTKPNGLHNGTVDISKPLTEILIMILKYQTNDALLLSRQLIGLAQFAKGGYFKNHSANLGHVLEKLFTSVIFKCPNEMQLETLGNLHNDTKAARRRAATSLIKIGNKVPDQMHTLFPDLIGRVVSLMTQKQILDSEKALLYETLVIVSNSKPNFEDQKLFIDQMMDQPLKDWNLPNSKQIISSPENLIQMLQASSADNRWKIYSLLQIFHCVGKRTRIKKDKQSQIKRHPFIHHWPKILPNTFILIKTIHSIWEPKFREKLEQSQMCWIQRIAPLEIRSAMGFEDHYVNIPGAHHQSVAVSSNQWKHNVNVGGPDFASLMTHLRRESYDILKIAAFQTASMQQGHIGFLKNPLTYTPGQGGLFDWQNLNAVLVHSLFNGIDYMELRHLRLLISQFMNPFTLSCPLPLANPILLPLLRNFFQHTTSKLQNTWQTWKTNPDERNPWHFPVGMEPDVKLMVDERILCDASREYVSYLREIFPAKPLKLNKNGAATKQDLSKQNSPHTYLTELGKIVMMNHEIIEQICLTLASVIIWPDTKCLILASQVIERILPHVSKDGNKHALLGHILKSLLTVLLNNENHGKTNQGHLVALVTSTYCRISFGWIPVHEGGGGDLNIKPGVTIYSDVAREVLCILPNVDKNVVLQLDEKLKKAALTDRAKRTVFQSFLTDVSASMGGKNDGSSDEDSILAKKQLNIVDLPKSSNGRITPNGGVVTTNVFGRNDNIDGDSLLKLFGNDM